MLIPTEHWQSALPVHYQNNGTLACNAGQTRGSRSHSSCPGSCRKKSACMVSVQKIALLTASDECQLSQDCWGSQQGLASIKVGPTKMTPQVLMYRLNKTAKRSPQQKRQGLDRSNQLMVHSTWYKHEGFTSANRVVWLT